ncbi:MAG: sugar ABC transporter permease [Rhodospirillaceae bacterium]|nr:sugar ABC transporter permease [Rhodospirillaceae bacterium]MBT3927243.1 sugar ABC transporter permease [Rhodospirillaceae bacterium]MBT6830745.1 sugar ABC transporter permease [Rhodospirillaceae bacterium]MBT7292733.1 sugar ABC transporter permease [Rhodospirillaceae bacterium]
MGSATTVQSGSTKTFLWVCMGPVLIFLIVVAVAPLTLALIDSFRELSMTSLTKRGAFIGLDNYRDLIGKDSHFYGAILHTAILMAIAVPLEFVFGLLIALWINRAFTGRRLVLTILMIPTMIAPVVVGMIWRFFLMPSFGVMTVYLNDIGLFEETCLTSAPMGPINAIA